MSHEPNPQSGKKVHAIYSLRQAAEAKAVAEMEVKSAGTPASRDKLLDAQIELESKTQDAIDACHECGHAHAANEPHLARNIVTVDFPKKSQKGQ
jgi:DNA-directed RNA polymerase subunit M/transcription elongation factor TFIIS